MPTVRYVNWWHGFDPVHSYVPRLVRESLGCPPDLVDDSRPVDVEVHSAMTRLSPTSARGIRAKRASVRNAAGRRAWLLRQLYGIGPKGSAAKHVWYTGENLRPPVGWDATLSFDLDDFGGSNFYLPYWALRMGALGGADVEGEFSPTNAALTSARSPVDLPIGFACMLARNPHPMRMRALQALSSLGKVDAYGAAFGRPVSSKAAVFSKYRFAIVFENDLYPGYVTEKVIEAWLSGCVPIWWGDDPAGYINPKAMVNLHGMSMNGLVETVRHLEESPDLWASMRSEPILVRPFDHASAVRFLAERIT